MSLPEFSTRYPVTIAMATFAVVLLGWISLGEKRSDALYTSEDRDLLETLANAQKRGATVLAEVLGYGSTADAFRVTDMHDEARGAQAALQAALKDADVTIDDSNSDRVGIMMATGGTIYMSVMTTTIQTASITTMVMGRSGASRSTIETTPP